MTTGVKPSPTQVYNPDHDVNLPFKGGRVNPDSVSKVVDENGEPLVVYHGTTENFTEFAGRQSWKAQFKEDIGTSYFTSDKEMAEGYANGKNPIAVFLSLKNPYQYNADGMSYFGANYNSLTKAREDDHDGVMITNVEDTSAGQEERLIDTYITFSPNQIKSVTGNNGNFDGNDANILHQDKLANRGSFSPSTNTITLLKNADLSTFLHETGHFFLEVQFDIAARMTQEVEALGATPGQQAILDDTQALLNWFGVDSLDTWFNFKPLFFVFCQNKWGSLIGSILQIAIYTK